MEGKEKSSKKTRPGAGKSPALGGSACRPLRPTTNLCTGRPTSRISPDRAGWLPRTPGRSCPRPSGKDRTGPRRSARSTACPRATPPDDLGVGQVFLGFSGTQSERLPKSFAGRHTDEPAGWSSLAVRHAGGQFTAGGLAKPGTSQAVSLRFGDDRLDLGQFPHWMPPRLGEYPPQSRAAAATRGRHQRHDLLALLDGNQRPLLLGMARLTAGLLAALVPRRRRCDTRVLARRWDRE
jgi:hypothetical protein